MTGERMACPRCPGGDLRELERDRIIIDRCSTCGGIWLDRGELERLLAREHGEQERAAHDRQPLPREATHGPSLRERRRDDDDDDDDFGRRGHDDDSRSSAPPRKRGLLGALGDLFD